MTNAQEDLNQKYPPNKAQVETIYLEDLNFNQLSELIIDNYPNLEKITNNYQEISNLTQLTITNCPQLERISIYSLKNNQQLTLNNLPKLNKLDCQKNNLTTLDLREKLEYLDLSHNNLHQDLSFLSSLVNLKNLYLNNNPLYGSLEYLKDISELRILDISNTDLDSGLEYLPDSIEEFSCSATTYREDAKSQNIYNLFAKEKITEEAEQSQQMVSQLKEELQLEQEAAQSYDETQLGSAGAYVNTVAGGVARNGKLMGQELEFGKGDESYNYLITRYALTEPNAETIQVKKTESS
ncbi:14060_t:CDS:2 [Entrophospora sp. SA101]|nr:14060_t:CDS:2 [Entrophospora sp. SA101]